MQKKPESPPGSLQLIRLYLECFLIRALRRQQDGKRALFLHENEYDSRVLTEVSDCLKKMVYGGFSLADLCRRVGMSKTRLYEFYEKHTGMTMGEHFIKLRLEEAKRLYQVISQGIQDLNSPLQATVLRKRFLLGYSPEKIARQLHYDVSYIHKQKKDGIKNLKLSTFVHSDRDKL